MIQADSPLILIADTDADSRAAMAAILKDAGYNVLQAVDGGSAVKAAMDHDVAVAIVDNAMTPRTGLDFARQMRLLGASIGIIMTTGEDSGDLLFEASRHGIVQILKKPVERDMLLGAVARCADKGGST